MNFQNTRNYESLAKIYDYIMLGVEYNLWFDLITDLCLENNFVRNAKILEIGGGTGVLGGKLSDYGFEYFGSDLSFGMAKAAKDKGLNFVCADCQHLPFIGSFDMAIFLFDGINYLFEAKQFTRTFEQVHSVLKDGGLFLFDITTQTNSTNNFLNYRESYAGENYAYIRESYYDTENFIQHNDFEIFVKEKGKKGYQRYCERHIQKVHPVRNIIDSIPLDLFEVEGIWGNFDRRKWSMKSERVHFLLRKKRLEAQLPQ